MSFATYVGTKVTNRIDPSNPVSVKTLARWSFTGRRTFAPPQAIDPLAMRALILGGMRRGRR